MSKASRSRRGGGKVLLQDLTRHFVLPPGLTCVFIQDVPTLPLAYWVHNLDPFLIHFTDSIGIRYYGTAYVLGFVGAAWFLLRYAKKGLSKLGSERIWDLMTALMIGVYAGGRLGHFFLYEGLGKLKDDPLALLRVWEGGMAFHGGLVGVVLALAVFAWRSKVPFLHVGDLVASVTPLGLFFGRIANFINGELWGKTTDVSWAVIFPLSAEPGTPIANIAARHPSQLYEAMLEGLLLFAFCQWRVWKTEAMTKTPGRLSAEFLFAYGCARIVCEIFREPDFDVTPILGLSRGTFYSVFLLAAGVLLWLYSSGKRNLGQTTKN